MPHGQSAGYLGKAYDPFVLNADPSDPNFKVPDMLPPDYLTALRVDRRKNWREMVDKSVSLFETSQDARLLDSNVHQAYTLMSSQKARDAFELHREPEKIREAEISVEILRGGKSVFGGSTSIGRIKRSFEELIGYLFRNQSFPSCVLLLTATGIVTPDDFTLVRGDEVRIIVEPIGVLSNICK